MLWVRGGGADNTFPPPAHAHRDGPVLLQAEERVPLLQWRHLPTNRETARRRGRKPRVDTTESTTLGMHHRFQHNNIIRAGRTLCFLEALSLSLLYKPWNIWNVNLSYFFQWVQMDRRLPWHARWACTLRHLCLCYYIIYTWSSKHFLFSVSFSTRAFIIETMNQL